MTTPGATVAVTMSTQYSGYQLKSTGTLTRDDFDGGPVSLDLILPGLYLGNLTAAMSMETLKAFKISHILTLDSVPLLKHITEASFLTTKYVHIADMTKEDILHHLDPCVQFIVDALNQSANILVHCYFGVSRSSAVVIAYVMKELNLSYTQAIEFVKSKRRFVQPNAGFVAQLKLYGQMGCRINPKYQKYKLYRLRMAGEQVRKAKILPHCFNNLIKSDPAITQENPEPNVYRCRKCRRILVSRSHILAHPIKQMQLQQQQQLKENAIVTTGAASAVTTDHPSLSSARLLQQIAEDLRKTSIESLSKNVEAINVEGDDVQTTSNDITTTELCQTILFVEPIAWMKNILNNTQGRLNCPKCDQKVGNFSWINGCQCPCGEDVSPAFYLIPSRVELSKAVQNVQTTV